MEENAVLALLAWVFTYNSATIEQVIDHIWNKTDKKVTFKMLN